MYIFEFDKLINVDGHIITRLMYLKSPRIALFNNFLSKEECEQLLVQAKQKKFFSGQDLNAYPNQHKEIDFYDRFSGIATQFKYNETSLISKIDNRIAKLTKIPLENGEPIKILNYKNTNQLKPHLDYFQDNNYVKKYGQRIATFVIYLNTSENGGETYFSELGLSIAPKQGCALFFANVNEDFIGDPKTLHASLPVTQGEKWIITKWIRERKFK